MTTSDRSLRRRATWMVVVLSALGPPAFASDGVIEINQARALAGGVTPSDTPGFPVTINVGGSYRLTGTLSLNSGQADTNAITVATSNGVVIDLNGFALEGPSSCSNVQACTPAGTSRGIDATAAPAATVRNGSVHGFPGGGLVLGTRARVEAIKSFNNGADGIHVFDNSMVTGCSAASNVGNGIQTGQSATVDGNTADHNGQNGIQTSVASVITHNTTAGNNTGIAAGFTSTVVENSATSNSNVGIACSSGCTLVGNAAYDNDGVGFQLDAGSGYSQSTLRLNNGGDDQPQVLNGVDFGQNICGAPGFGNGIACP
jgi:hypothetical protein